jgi:hypothetical protein
MGTAAHQTGWLTQPETFEYQNRQIGGKQIVTVGVPPWRVQRLDARLTLANPHLNKATVLDANGYARQTLPMKSTRGGLTLELPDDALYVILEAH